MKCDHCGCTLADNTGVTVTRDQPTDNPTSRGQATVPVQVVLCPTCANERGRTTTFVLVVVSLLLLAVGLIALLTYLIT